MKRIICFTESLGGGGAEHQMVILAELLAEKGYDVSIVTYADVPDHYSVPDGVKRIKIAEGKSAIKKHFAIISHFIKAKMDCVISYRKMCNIRALVPLFFRGKQVKVICSERNTTMGKPDFERRLMVHVLYNRADFIVPNSESQTQYMRKENPRLISKLRTIHNYTDLQHFTECDLPTMQDVLKIAVFARYSKQKNPILFAEALAELKTKANRAFEVHWYGSQAGANNGYNNDYLAVKAKIEELGIGDVLKLHPAVKDIYTLMGDYHAVCLPSLYEGFSNSIAEAICCGKPMLVSDVADNGIMVHNGENGFLFDPKHTDSICDAFLRFFALSSGDLKRMASESRRIAEELFDKERFISQYMELIES